jgi:hypothetical protein
MKILLTGFNKAQCTKDFFFRQQLKVTSTQYSLYAALTDMGHDVEQRPVSPGEDLSSYDKIIVFIHTPQSYCQFLYGGMYAVGFDPDKVILGIDDWQCDSIVKQVQRMLDDEFGTRQHDPYREYLLALYQGSESVEELKKWENIYVRGLQVITAGDKFLLLPGYQGGNRDPQFLLKRDWTPEKIKFFDPNPYNYRRTPENGFLSGGISEVMGVERTPAHQKKKQWVFSSLVQGKTRKWLEKAGASWPVQIYGGLRGEFKSERLEESEMCRAYMENWGCLTPRYYHAGSGFWRPRALQVADAGSIMVCDSAEGWIYSEAHVGLTAKIVESMDDTQRENLAKSQREGFLDNHPIDKNRTKRQLEEVLG